MRSIPFALVALALGFATAADPGPMPSAFTPEPAKRDPSLRGRATRNGEAGFATRSPGSRQERRRKQKRRGGG